MKGYGGFVKAVIASEVRNGFFNDDFFGTPKILLPLLGKPLLGYMTDMLSFYGMNEIVLLLDAQSEKVSEYLKNNPTCGAKVKPIIGKSINDALNPLFCSDEKEDDNVLLITDNVLFDFDLSEAEKYHRSMGADVTVIITHCDGVTGEKLVFTSPSGRITGFSGSVGLSLIHI